jgi:hypothetical protein
MLRQDLFVSEICIVHVRWEVDALLKRRIARSN